MPYHPGRDEGAQETDGDAAAEFFVEGLVTVAAQAAAFPIGMTTRRDLSHRGPVRRGSHEAFRRADDGGGLARVRRRT